MQKRFDFGLFSIVLLFEMKKAYICGMN